MRIHEIMGSEVETIAADATVAAAPEKMSFVRIHHLVVMEGGSWPYRTRRCVTPPT
jgi:hypothetical protein